MDQFQGQLTRNNSKRGRVTLVDPGACFDAAPPATDSDQPGMLRWPDAEEVTSIVYTWSKLAEAQKWQARRSILAWLGSRKFAQAPKVWFPRACNSITNCCSVRKSQPASAVKSHTGALDTRACPLCPRPQTAGFSNIDLPAANL